MDTVLTAVVTTKALVTREQSMGITYMALRRRSPDEKDILLCHHYSK